MKRLAVVALVILASVAGVALRGRQAETAGYSSPFTLVRAKANLAATTTVTTLGVACLGARQVVFYLRAAQAEGDSLSLLGIEVSNDGTNWVPAARASGITQVNINGPLNAGGRAVVGSGSSSTNAIYIPWARARLSVTSGAGAIDSLYIHAFVMDDVNAQVARERLIPPL